MHECGRRQTVSPLFRPRFGRCGGRRYVLPAAVSSALDNMVSVEKGSAQCWEPN